MESILSYTYVPGFIKIAKKNEITIVPVQSSPERCLNPIHPVSNLIEWLCVFWMLFIPALHTIGKICPFYLICNKKEQSKEAKGTIERERNISESLKNSMLSHLEWNYDSKLNVRENSLDIFFSSPTCIHMNDHDDKTKEEEVGIHLWSIWWWLSVFRIISIPRGGELDFFLSPDKHKINQSSLLYIVLFFLVVGVVTK